MKSQSTDEVRSLGVKLLAVTSKRNERHDQWPAILVYSVKTNTVILLGGLLPCLNATTWSYKNKGLVKWLYINRVLIVRQVVLVVVEANAHTLGYLLDFL